MTMIIILMSHIYSFGFTYVGQLLTLSYPRNINSIMYGNQGQCYLSIRNLINYEVHCPVRMFFVTRSGVHIFLFAGMA